MTRHWLNARFILVSWPKMTVFARDWLALLMLASTAEQLWTVLGGCADEP
jgi:hypothetical protein